MTIPADLIVEFLRLRREIIAVVWKDDDDDDDPPPAQLTIFDAASDTPLFDYYIVGHGHIQTAVVSVDGSYCAVKAWAVKWSAIGLTPILPVVLFKMHLDIPAGQALSL